MLKSKIFERDIYLNGRKEGVLKFELSIKYDFYVQ